MARHGHSTSEQGELAAECLATLLEVAPTLGAADQAHVARLHPFATAEWLDNLCAAGAGQVTEDTQLIEQLEQQVATYRERERRLLGALQAERQRTREADDRALGAPSPHTQQMAVPPMRMRPVPQSPGAGTPGGTPGGSRKPTPNGRPPIGHGQRSQYGAQQSPPPTPPGEEEAPAPRRRPQPRRPAAGPRNAPPPRSEYEAEEEELMQAGLCREIDDELEPEPLPAPTAQRKIPFEQAFSGPGTDDEDDVPEGVRSPGEDDEEEEERRIAQRGGQRFDSISEEIKALNSGLIEESELSTAPAVDNRAGCPHCGRKFVPARLERHVKVCEDLQRGKEWRGVHSSKEQRAKGQMSVTATW